MKTIREIALTPYYPYGKNKEKIIAERIFEVDEALDKHEECIRTDEREMLLNELWRTLCKYKQDINDANYGFVFVEIAFNEVKNKHNK